VLRRKRCEPKVSTMKFYKNDLTDSQWEVIKTVLAEERKRQHDLRLICNLLLYLLRTGCQWRELPDRGVCWEVVYYYFRKWQASGVIEQLHEHLYTASRKKKKRPAKPTAAVMDSQSVKTVLAQEAVGYDAGKKVKGRKRHLLVDTQGWLLSVHVSGAEETDRKGAKQVLGEADSLQLSKLEIIYADGGYSGKLEQELAKEYDVEICIIKKQQKQGFKVLPKRWVVERTFAWLDKCRRLSKDYERLTSTSEAFIRLAMCRLMLNYTQI
jgi:putative transposase